MKGFRSIRWRLQLWYGLLLLVVLGGFGLTAFQLESGRQSRALDAELRRRLPALVESQRPVRGGGGLREFRLFPRYEGLFDSSGSGGFYYVVWLRHGVQPVIRSEGAPADVPMPGPEDPPVRRRALLREVFQYSGPGDCVLVGCSTAVDRSGLIQFAGWLVAAGLAVLVLGLIVGSWLVDRALRPIGQISAAAGRIATGDLTQRIDVADTESELGGLAAVLNSTFARLDAAFGQQARFTADAAHELRTPVSVVMTHAQNGVAVPCGCPEHAEAFDAIRRAAQRMRRLISSLLELARMDAGQEPFRREQFDLAEVARDCLELLQPLGESKQVRVVHELQSVSCQGDPDRIAQVITNLVANALQHSSAEKEVRVKVGLVGGRACFSVADSGPGISSEELPHIFDRFRRSATSVSRGGFGLGLAISRSILDALGGSMEAVSELNRGSEFRFFLPSS